MAHDHDQYKMKPADEVARNIMGELGLIGSSTISWEGTAEKHLADIIEQARREGAVAAQSELDKWRERIAQMRIIDDLDHRLRFGKYAGHRLQDMLDRNPGYINWAVDNVEWFILSERLEETFEQAAELKRIQRQAYRAYGDNRFDEDDYDDEDWSRIHDTDIVTRLIRRQVGSCTCGTKTNFVNAHEIGCDYRTLVEAVDRIEELEDGLKALAEDYSWSRHYKLGGYADSHPVIVAFNLLGIDPEESS